jgi:hypothetical protein
MHLAEMVMGHYVKRNRSDQSCKGCTKTCLTPRFSENSSPLCKTGLAATFAGSMQDS